MKFSCALVQVFGIASLVLLSSRPALSSSFLLRQSGFDGGGNLYGHLRGDDKNNDDWISLDELDSLYFEWSGDSEIPDFKISLIPESDFATFYDFSLFLGDSSTEFTFNIKLALQETRDYNWFLRHQQNEDGIFETTMSCTGGDCWQSVHIPLIEIPGRSISATYSSITGSQSVSSEEMDFGKVVCARKNACQLELDKGESQEVPEPSGILGLLALTSATLKLRGNNK